MRIRSLLSLLQKRLNPNLLRNMLNVASLASVQKAHCARRGGPRSPFGKHYGGISAIGWVALFLADAKTVLALRPKRSGAHKPPPILQDIGVQLIHAALPRWQWP